MKQRKSVVFDVLFTAACLLLVLFYTANSEAIQHFFTRKLVIPYLQKTNTVLNYPNQQQSFVGWAIYLLLLLMIGFPLLRYVWIHRKRRYPRAIICLSGLLSFFYLHARCGNSPWMFFPSNHSLKYVDMFGFTAILFMIFGFRARLRVTPYKKSSNILLSLINHHSITDIIKTVQEKKSKILKKLTSNPITKLKNIIVEKNEELNNKIDYLDITSSNGFSFDNPIDKSKNSIPETLGRTKVAETIAHKIRNTFDTQSAFAVGISGEWGSGKTSFLNLIKHELENHENKQKIIIEFSPWKNHSDTTIITDFFDTLGSELARYDFQLKRQLQQYANVLVDAEVDTLTKYAKQLKSALSGTQSVAEMYEDIDARISAIGYQIIIFIDDLDRLYKKEILETLKLIRNSAAFGNVVFVAAYHKEYVIENIGQEIKNCNNYLEKIFQFEFYLPVYDEKVYLEGFIKIIKKSTVLSKDDIEKIRNLNNRILLNDGEYFLYDEPAIERDESYSFFSAKNFNSLRDVTRFANQFIVNVELLYHYSNIIDLLFIEYIRFKDPAVYELVYKNQNDIFINQHVPYLDFLDQNNKEYKKLLKSIFQNNKNDNSYDKLSLSNPEAFDRYFINNLLNTDISINDFETAFSGGENFFIEKCCTWICDQKLTSIIFLLDVLHGDDSFRLLLKIGQSNSLKNNINYNFEIEEHVAGRIIISHVGIEKLESKKNSSNDERHLLLSFKYKEKLDKLKIWSVDNLYSNAKYPYIFEFKILYFLVKDDELKEIALKTQNDLFENFKSETHNISYFLDLIKIHYDILTVSNNNLNNYDTIINLGNEYLERSKENFDYKQLIRMYNTFNEIYNASTKKHSNKIENRTISMLIHSYFIKRNIDEFLNFYFSYTLGFIYEIAPWIDLLNYYNKFKDTNKITSDVEISKIEAFNKYYNSEQNKETYDKFKKETGYEKTVY